ncbi:hypothetical protein JRQ81_010858, partial [Phrynocephalus forsythii]
PGLLRLLSAFSEFCSKNMNLIIKTKKSKFLIFSKTPKPNLWKVDGKPVEQVRSFRYLGFLFHHQLNWSHHRMAAITVSKSHLLAISQFHFHSGNPYAPAALQIFQTKILNQLLYGIQGQAGGFIDSNQIMPLLEVIILLPPPPPAQHSYLHLSSPH